MPTSPPSPVPIYHFTHIDNLPSIIEHGLLPDTRALELKYVNSGSPAIKSRRLSLPIIIEDKRHGFVGECTPFYYAPRSPMLYTQKCNGLVNQIDLVYLVSSVEHLWRPGGYECYFSDRNAAKNLALFYDTPEDLASVIRWDYMEEVMWNNTDDHPDRKERRMAEFLVKLGVVWVDISALAVYDETHKMQVTDIVARATHQPQILVKPSWYFS